jgi:hypothetical protein
MKNKRQGIRSTKQRVQPIVPPPTLPQQSDIYITTYDTSNTLYTDQTGKFPISSSNGHKYIMVAVELDGNFIDAEPIQS